MKTTPTVICPRGVSKRLFNAIMRFDLTRIRQRMANETGKSMTAIARLENEWKKYVLLLIQNPGKAFPMSDPVDQFAHEHLADTRNFREFCKLVGGTIHHQPTVNESEKTALLPSYLSDTIPAMERLFGKVSQRIWPRNRCVCRYDLEMVAAT